MRTGRKTFQQSHGNTEIAEEVSLRAAEKRVKGHQMPTHRSVFQRKTMSGLQKDLHICGAVRASCKRLTLFVGKNPNGKSQFKSNDLTKIYLILSFAMMECAVLAQSWTNVYPGPAPGGIPGPFMVLDQRGNAYITGNVTNADTSLGYVTIGYSSNGQPLWTNLFRGPGYSYMSSKGIALGSNATVYVTGGAADTNNEIQYATLAYSANGACLWTNWYQGAGTGGASGVGVAVGLNGVIYVTGNDGNYATIAYSNNGTALWTNRYGATGNNIACSIAVAPNGNVYVTGSSAEADADFQFATIAYSSGGAPLWTNCYAGPQDSEQTARGLAVDSGNNVYVTGLYATVAYASDGTPLWTNEYDGWASAIAVDASSNCYVTGSTTDSEGLWDYETIKYSHAGVPLWTNIVAGSATFGNMANAIAVDGSGDVYVTGEAGTANEGGDYLTVAYSTDGVPLWTNRFNGVGNYNDIPSSIALDVVGDIYVTGESDGGGVFQHTTIKFIPPPALVAGDKQFGFAGSQFGFDLYGRIGSSVVIESSSDLQNWSPLATNALAHNLVHFIDLQPPVTGPRFYRSFISVH
jgi:hypothetical protein